jgi:hypothetical protein
MDLLKIALTPAAPAPAPASTIKPVAGKFKEQFAKLGGAAREALILAYIDAGLVDRPKLVQMPVKDPKDPNKTLMSMEVMPDYFTIEGMPVQMSALTADKIAKHFGLTLPTREMTRATYSGAKNKIPGQPAMHRLGDDSSKFIDYNKDIMDARKKLKNYDPNAVTVGEYKEFELKHENDNLHAAGFLDSNGKMIQDYKGSTMHPADYVDYSTLPRFYGSFNIPGESKPLTLQELVEKGKTDPKYKQYADAITGGKNYTGYDQKQKGTPAQATPAQAATPAQTPTTPNVPATQTETKEFVDELSKDFGVI